MNLNKLCSLFSQSCKINLLDVKLLSPIVEQKRTGAYVIFKKNIAYPRRLPAFKSRPMPFRYNWLPQPPADGEYTVKPLKAKKLGGRDPQTGRVAISTVGGGVRKFYRWVDDHYLGEKGDTIEEKVFKVRHDPFQTALLALVARNGHQRWIIASENMKPGDIITTKHEIPKNPIYAKEGQSWPVGALSPGTLVHRLETIPGGGGLIARAAGTSCEIIRRAGRKIIVRKPTGQEIGIDEWCMAAVGRVSNPNHYTVSLACTDRAWWKGKRPNRGVGMRKDGYCGRKLRPPKPLQIIDVANLLPKKTETIQLRTWQFS